MLAGRGFLLCALGLFVFCSPALGSATIEGSDEQPTMNDLPVPIRRELAGGTQTSDLSTGGLLCFASANTASAATQCTVDQVLSDSTGCAGSIFGAYTCPIFGFFVNGTAGFCFDTVAHAADATVCNNTQIAVDTAQTGACYAKGQSPAYVYYCSKGLPEAPPAPAGTACSQPAPSGRRLLLSTFVDEPAFDAADEGLFSSALAGLSDAIRRRLGASESRRILKTPSSSSSSPSSSSRTPSYSTPSYSTPRPASTPTYSTPTYATPTYTPTYATATSYTPTYSAPYVYRAPTYSYKPVYTPVVSYAVVPVTYSTVYYSQPTYYVNPYYARSPYYYRYGYGYTNTYAPPNPCKKKSKVAAIVSGVVVPVSFCCICACCFFAYRRRQETTYTTTVQAQYQMPAYQQPMPVQQGYSQGQPYGVQMQQQQPYGVQMQQPYGGQMQQQMAPPANQAYVGNKPPIDWDAWKTLDGRVPIVARSPEQDTPPCKMTFRNATGGPVTFFWLDPGGEERGYDTIMPGQSCSMDTYIDHCWAARGPSGGLICVYRGRWAQQQVVVA